MDISGMIPDFILKVPVLLIGFNRPEVIKRSFECIRAARPEKLYVVIDGPRDHIKTDHKLVEEVRNIVQKIDWPCDVKFRFHEINKGAEITVSSAISWVLEKEKYVIVIEDDIIAPVSFFRFAEEMLILYENEPSIATVTGSNFTPIPLPGNTDYFFGKYGHSWGWGTWQRFWKDFDLYIEIHDEHLTKTFLKKICNSNAEVKFYKRIFQSIRSKGKGNSTWDAVGLYLHRINNSLSVIPRINLTSNIGVIGLHSTERNESHFRVVDETFKVNRHPCKIECFTDYDKYHFETYINRRNSLFKKFIKKLKYLLKSNNLWIRLD